MCDPLTIAGIAASAAGAAANYKALGDVAAARSGVLTAERQRQAGLDSEAAGVNSSSLGRFSNFGGDTESRAAALTDMYKNPNGTTVTPTPNLMPASNSEITNRDIASKSGIAKDYTNQQADALGRVRAFGDVLATDNRGLARDAITLGQIGGFKKGSSDATAYELDNANNAGNDAAFLGNVLGGVGKIGITAGLSGGSAKLASMFGSAPQVAGAPLNILPPVAQVGPQTVFPAGASPFRTYG